MANKLYRSRDKRMVAGICGGIGEYFNVDPTIIRLILVALCFMGFAGIIAYIIAWVIIPEEPGYRASQPPAESMFGEFPDKKPGNDEISED